MKRCVFLLCMSLCVLGSASAQTKRALIIGIDLYQPAGTTATHDAGCAYGRCELGSFENLEGSVNDAQSMADVLTSPKFGFPANNVTLLTDPAPRKVRPGVVTLSVDQTARDGILAAMKKYLVDVPQPGDTVVFYDASHGSLRVNTASNKLTVRDENGNLVHVDSTLVPSDAYKGGYDVRDREMTRIFNAALDKGVHLTVIFDSCHSGGTTRGLGAMRQRSLPYDPRPVTDPSDTLANGERAPSPTERTDNPALVFTAVQQDQAANEADPTQTVPESHGAFTEALLETLQVLPADAPASLVYQRVKAELEGNGVPDQEPDLDASAARRAQPLFGGTAGTGDAGKVRTAALKVDDDGSVWLDIGMVSGIGPGSEFTAIVTPAGRDSREVADRQGAWSWRVPARPSSSPAGAKVQIRRRLRTDPPDSRRNSSPLRFCVGPANLSSDDIIEQRWNRSRRLAWRRFPIQRRSPTPTFCSWNGTAWTLHHVDGAPSSHSFFSFQKKKPATVTLGVQFTADALKAHVTPTTKLWADLPASRELAEGLKLSDPSSEAQATAVIGDASYVLAGSLVKGDAGYTWFHKNESATVPHVSAIPDHSPGCSTSSPYPVRSDWVTIADSATAPTAAGTLNTYSSRLGKIHGWLQLSNNAVAGASESNYFQLTLVSMTNTNPVDPNHPVTENDRYGSRCSRTLPSRSSAGFTFWTSIAMARAAWFTRKITRRISIPARATRISQIILRHAPTSEGRAALRR